MNYELNMLTRSTTLGPGDQAPDFTLPSSRGDRQSLRDYLTRGAVVLVFHRGTW
jgi:peroxiredoxin